MAFTTSLRKISLLYHFWLTVATYRDSPIVPVGVTFKENVAEKSEFGLRVFGCPDGLSHITRMGEKRLLG